MNRVSVMRVLAGAVAAGSLVLCLDVVSAQTNPSAQPQSEESGEAGTYSRAVAKVPSPGGIAGDSDFMMNHPGGCPEWPNCADESGAAGAPSEAPTCAEGSECPKKE